MNELLIADPRTQRSDLKILERFKGIQVDESWTFDEVKRRDTSYITHDYHRYPAKFIPQVASKLIHNFTKKKDLICDPFMGSGTTLVESLVNGRKAVGVDINPTAYIVSKAKTTPIEPKKLEKEVKILLENIELNISNDQNLDTFLEVEKKEKIPVPTLERIDYWFDSKTKESLSIIWYYINKTEDEKIKIFFQCAFSHILKNCSRWMMKSTKPTIDKNKVIPNPFNTFKRHLNKMKRKNDQFFEIFTKSSNDQKGFCKVELGDCRSLPCKNSEVDLIVTSPPYVTSYEYADLHQLTVLWFGYETNIQNLRSKFIGTSQKKDISGDVDSLIAEETFSQLESINQKKMAREVKTYFIEMQECLEEMFRVLKPKGKAAIVIGNTALKKVPIYNAEIFAEISIHLGFRIYDIIKRRIPSGGKILPSTRDPVTGRFVSMDKSEKVEAYSYEYILIIEKPN